MIGFYFGSFAFFVFTLLLVQQSFHSYQTHVAPIKTIDDAECWLYIYIADIYIYSSHVLSNSTLFCLVVLLMFSFIAYVCSSFIPGSRWFSLWHSYVVLDNLFSIFICHCAPIFIRLSYLFQIYFCSSRLNDWIQQHTNKFETKIWSWARSFDSINWI